MGGLCWHTEAKQLQDAFEVKGGRPLFIVKKRVYTSTLQLGGLTLFKEWGVALINQVQLDVLRSWPLILHQTAAIVNNWYHQLEEGRLGILFMQKYLGVV